MGWFSGQKYLLLTSSSSLSCRLGAEMCSPAGRGRLWVGEMPLAKQ